VCGADSKHDLEKIVTDKSNRLVKWLKNSGLSVNAQKTELMVFNTHEALTIIVDNKPVTSSKTMKCLGVLFDNKLTWTEHINETIKKVQGVQFGLTRLKKYFEQEELLRMVTTLGLSKLYYGAPVWLSRGLNDVNLRKLLSVSANLIKACITRSDWALISYIDLHQMAGKATPTMMSDYFQATALHKIVETQTPDLVWTKLQMNYRMNRRTNSITFGNGSISIYGKNNLANRVQHVSNRLPPGWEGLTTNAFKTMAKRVFMMS